MDIYMYVHTTDQRCIVTVSFPVEEGDRVHSCIDCFDG